MMRRETEALSLQNSESSSNFTYATALSEISPLNWSGDLRYLPELSFIQLCNDLLARRQYTKIPARFSEGNKL